MLQKKTMSVLVLVVAGMTFLGCDKIAAVMDHSSPKKENPLLAMPAPEIPAVTPPAETAPVSPKQAAPAQMTKDTLAKVGTWTLTLPEFKERLAALKEAVPDYDINDLEQNKMILQELIRQQLLVQYAEKEGVAAKPEIKQAVEEFRRTLLVREIATQLTEGISVTEEEAKAYYDENTEAFAEPGKWRVREIVVKDEQEAKDILVELYKGTDFVEMVKAHSISNSAWQKGDLGLLAEFAFPKMQQVVETLEVGDISGVFAGPEGYYIVKLEEKQGGEPQPFEDIKEDIITGLTILKQQDAIMEKLQTLEQSTDIEINEQLLEE